MKTLLILYHSQEFGNTKAMAEAIAEGAQFVGAKVTLVNTNKERFDIEKLRQFDVVAFGTPDYWGYIAGGLKVFVDDFYIVRKNNRQGLENKPYGLFYSHGGGGRVLEPFEKLFKAMKVGAKIGDTVESYGHPNESVLEACRQLGRQIIESIK